MRSISFKLIFRSWWRNKIFAVISIFSLAVGIACTNLLAAFVIHEYNIEAGNPNKNHIYCLVQDSPFQLGDKVFFATSDVLSIIKDRYPEVEDCLCLNTTGVSQITIGEMVYDPITVMLADASLPHFFPCQTVAGNLEEALTEPNKIALTETTARRFFGKEDPIGQTISINHSPEKGNTYQVVAVVKENDQSILTFDGITAINPDYGGTAFILMNQTIDPEAFAERLKADGVPTYMKDQGRYYLCTLQENLFNEYNAQSIYHLRKQNKLILDIGLFSALLILLIACFNYINLNFSRLLQQIKIIYVQKLMGASRIEINRQLFLDIFLTVLAGFIFSLLIMYDLIPVFNSILSGHMKTSFFFSGQVVPVLIGLVLILSIIPAIYISRKFAVLSRQRYSGLIGGKTKQRIIAILSVIQFTISIALIIATLMVNKQIGLIRRGGEGYRGLIAIDNMVGNESSMNTFVAELRTHPELGLINTTDLDLFHYGLRQLVISDPTGEKMQVMMAEFGGDSGFLSTFHIGLLQGMQPSEALQHLPSPVYVNQRFADLLVAKGENPIGKPLKGYVTDFAYSDRQDGSKENPTSTVAGVVDDFFVGSLEQEIPPAIIHIRDETKNTNNFVYFRLDSKYPERLNQVKKIWEKHNPGILFNYWNVYEEFIAFNKKAFGLADLLLMYSLISIFLTCFGLFGIALYAVEQRTKEIGIRKVNGAATGQIILLLNKQFIIWICMAFFIAVPVSWFFLNQWLQGFVYRTEIPFYVFLQALLVVTGIAMLTVSWHSYKAASGNPVQALKSE